MSNSKDAPTRMKQGDVLRKMREIQKKAAELLISDLIGNKFIPNSIEQATDHLIDKLGDPYYFITRNGRWTNEIRSSAIYLLIRNGFAKGGAVRLRDMKLSDWVYDEDKLRKAAEIEYLHGGNSVRAAVAVEQENDVKFIGDGNEAVYAYVDSLLEELGHTYTKIGVFNRSGHGEILARVVAQYGTSNPGKPILRLVCKTNNGRSLEHAIHTRFKDRQVDNAIGREWYKVSVDDISLAMEELRHGV